MDILEITVQRRFKENVWPVVVNKKSAGALLPTRTEGELALSEADHEKLTSLLLEPKLYGTVLGKALFVEGIRDEFVNALNRDGGLRVMLQVEDQELRQLRWERLCAPMGQGDWDHLALNERTLFSHYLPSATNPHFTPIGRRDLRALVLVASPEKTDQEGLPAFDVGKTVASVKASLGSISCDVLANTEGTQGAPTLNELIGKLTDPQTHYTLLHIVCHGKLTPKGVTILYWATAENQIARLNADNLIERLKKLDGNSIPHFVFLCTCESANPDAEDVGCLGGLAQRLIREVGIPAVVAMTEKITIETAQILASSFYKQLRSTGYVDTALVGAATQLADRPDVTVPALFSRLGDQPLFRDKLVRDLTKTEIEYGLKYLPELFQERAPVLKETIEKQAALLRATLGAELVALSPAAREQRQNALKELNKHCVEVLDLIFNALALEQLPPTYDSRCPFKGLSSFHSEDQQFFFGREELVETLKQMLKEHHFLAVLGPSGSGKSSVILAGLIPLIQKEEGGFEPVYMTPTSNPVAQLTASLEKSPGQLQLLIIDQFEELFTLCADKAVRQNFVEKLLEQIQIQKRRVVITMRADFWGECAPFQELKELMTARQKLIAPMDSTELRDAMDKQASAVGLRFEADLANTLLEDVNDEPGAMPLLQHALRELWKRRHGKWLLAEEYRKIGTVKKAIANTADEIYQSFNSQDQALVRNIFIRLAHLGNEAEKFRGIRQRVELDSLVPASVDPQKVKRIVSKLAGDNSRLVVTSMNQDTKKDEVEVTHEALIDHWNKLQDWLKENQKDKLLRERISHEAEDWSKSKKHETLMLRGGRLEDATNLLKCPEFGWNETEIKYVNACVRSQRKATVFLSLGLAFTTLIALLAWQQWYNAVTNEATAKAELANSSSRSGQIQGLVYAVDAVGLSRSWFPKSVPPAQVRSSLLSALQRVRERNVLSGLRSPIKAVAISADAQIIISATEVGEIWLLSRNGQPLLKEPFFQENDSMINLLAISADNQTVFVDSIGVKLWSLKDKKSSDPFCEVVSYNSVAVNPAAVVVQDKDGKVLLLSWDCKPLNEPFGEKVDQYTTPVAISPDGHTVLIADATGIMRLWSRKQDEPFQLLIQTFQHPGRVRSVAISDGGQTVVSLSEDQMIQLWSGDGDKIGEPFQHPSGATSVAISADGQTVVSGGEDGTVRLWARDIGLVGKPFPNEVGINSVAISRNGQTVVSGSKDGVRLWSQDGQQVRGPFPHPEVTSVAISADGQIIASQGNDNMIRLRSPDGKEVCNPPICTLPNTQQRDHGLVHTQVAISADGQTVVGGGRELRVWRSWRDSSPPIELPNYHKWTTAVAISADGQTIASSDETGSVQLWSPDRKSLNESFKTAQEQMQYKPMEMGNVILASVAISDDGKTVVSAGNKSGGVRLWSPDVRMQEGAFADNRWAWSVAISGDGETVVSGDAAGKIRLWSRDGQPLSEPFKDRGRGFLLAISGDGKTVVTDHAIWPIGDWETWLGKACDILRGHSIWEKSEKTETEQGAIKTCKDHFPEQMK